MRLRLALAALLAAACSPTVGTACDPMAARRVAYDELGTPAFAGQSMIVTSCAGQGWSCHSDRAIRRYASPVGTDFDLSIVESGESDGAVRLHAARVNVSAFRDSIYAQALSGQMPPLQIGARMLDERAVYRFADGTEVPSVRTGEGSEMLRNWLACGAPVVQATSALPVVACTTDTECPLTACDTTGHACVDVGYVEARGTTDLAPTWPSLYPHAIQRSCAIVSCHDASDAAGAVDLSSADRAFAAFAPRIVPGSAATSPLITLLTSGAQPYHATLAIDAMRTWIDAGALQN